MKLYLTKQRALEAHKINEAELDNLLARDDIKTILIDYGSGHEPAIYNDDLAAYVAERDIFPEQFNHLRGRFLGMNEASLLYGVSLSTLHKWIERGELKIQGRDGLKKLLDEADVAYKAKLSDAKKMRQGKKVFKSSGGD